MRKRKFNLLSRVRKSFVTKVIALNLAFFMLFEIAWPTCALALSGGPSQPEAGGFQPVDTSDMVDMFSGDFKYNIPLMDMDGYPLNISYSGNVSMDAEASWVGLGWSFNPGAVNRSMRGVPDDYNGEGITKTNNLKPSRNFGITAGLTFEFFGIDPDLFSGTLSYNLGVNYSNYYGIGVEQSIGANIKGQYGPLDGGLGITSSSENGLTISPNIGLSLSKTKTKEEKETTTTSSGVVNLGIGSSFNTRAGVKQLSVSTSISANQTVTSNSAEKEMTDSHDYGLGASGSFDLGMPTYTPQVGMPMYNISISGNFQTGLAFFGLHPSGYIGGSYAGQKLISKTQVNPAYGYMNLENGQNNDFAILDFNRENDGEFTTNTPNLPVTSLTYDMYSVSGQGVGGSYRPFRSEIGHVFDPYTYSTSEGYSIGVEFGSSSVLHGAIDLSTNMSNTNSGRWATGNAAATSLRYGKKGSNIDHEKYYFKEANEKSVDSDPAYYANMGGDKAMRFKLNKTTEFNVTTNSQFVNDQNVTSTIPTATYRQKRDKRNQVIQPLTIREVKDNGMGVNAGYPVSSYASTTTLKHHIGEITSYGTDGMRYVYGLPAYNTMQKEVSFAVGTDIYGANGLTGNCLTGAVTYSGTDNSMNNTRGLDNSYNATETPAYAHSYLLTAVLSPDYIDADNIKGPSIGDMGYYTKFSYKTAYNNYRWRVPIEANLANYSEGLKTDGTDDKASYVYGTKELLYVEKIESKNYIAVFTTENRRDALGVTGENGGADISQPSQLLRKISFYGRKHYEEAIAAGQTPVPLKVAHFEYDYSLCTGIPNRSDAVALLNANETGTGKLTLKKVYFTYQNSNKARLSPYEFTYSTVNPNYDIKGYDRWGSYKPNTGGCSIASAMPNAEYPYAEQDNATANTNSAAWLLTKIDLPSGGIINVEYESDDYASVQHKRAMQMFKVIGFDNTVYPLGTSTDIADGTKRLLFELDPDMGTSAADLAEYFDGIKDVYFKCLMQMRPGKYDYVAGYAELDPGQFGTTVATVSTGGTLLCGYVKLKTVKFNDADGTGTRNPIVKTAIQFGRLHLQRFMYNNPAITDADNLGLALVNELLTSGLMASLIANTTEFLKGPNKYLYDNQSVGKGLVMRKSWIRLNNPDKHKKGGGNRVKTIKMNDNWATMDSGSQSFDYGQEYFYDSKENGTGASTGVAAYEPQMGNEENPWKQAISFTIENRLAPDNKMYQEEPLGESFFPAPNVGYGKVTVQNLTRKNGGGTKIVTRHATGKVVHEFYTAKDFPTIVRTTARDMERDKVNPFTIASLFNISSRDYLTATQGFSIECNDMHGKPKKQSVFQEDITTPITYVEYKYKQAPYVDGSFKLVNSVSTISPKGDVTTNNVGVFFDMVADMRESRSKAENTNVNINGDLMVIIVPIAIAPIPIPKKAKDETQFRSATTTKVIQKFGILDETIAKDLGSVVSTKNLAYDSETGEVLVTQTTTDFNDAVYSVNYPAHWYYDKGMGQAYKNLGLTVSHTFSSGVATHALNTIPVDDVICNSSPGT